MLIRRLVIASLLAGAATAQAGTITTAAAQPSNVVSGWTGSKTAPRAVAPSMMGRPYTG